MIKRYTVHYDGVCGPTDPGAIAFAFRICEGETTVEEQQHFYDSHPRLSARDAEYMAIHAALHWLTRNDHTNDHVRFYGSTIKTVNQMNGRWAVPSSYSYSVWNINCRDKAAKFTDINFTWVSREDNVHARMKSREKMRENGIEPAAERFGKPAPNGGDNGQPTSTNGVRVERTARV